MKSGWVAGALEGTEYRAFLGQAGFVNISIQPTEWTMPVTSRQGPDSTLKRWLVGSAAHS